LYTCVGTEAEGQATVRSGAEHRAPSKLRAPETTSRETAYGSARRGASDGGARRHVAAGCGGNKRPSGITIKDVEWVPTVFRGKRGELYPDALACRGRDERHLGVDARACIISATGATVVEEVDRVVARVAHRLADRPGVERHVEVQLRKKRS